MPGFRLIFAYQKNIHLQSSNHSAAIVKPVTMRYKKMIFIISLLTGVVIFFMRCIADHSLAGNDPRGMQYAGSATCVSCHKDISNDYAHANHYKTSGKVSHDTLKKLIDSVNHLVYYPDSNMVQLEDKEGAVFQSHFFAGQMIRSEKADIAFGSAEKAQTYAYWKDDQLFQLPLTYFTSRKIWTNSPGYPMRKPYFDRLILSRCFECHASYVSKTDIQTGPLQVSEKMVPGSIIYGIDCERCHGPAAGHVRFQQENPAVKQAKFMVSVKSLSRQQQLDMCASCHSGNDLDVQRSLFAFRPGDTLSDFFYPHFGTGSAEPDVHGRQMQLLQTSKCFKQTKMTCMTCHDAHRQEENKMQLFISKCISCHQNQQHSPVVKMAGKNCIGCHMPMQVSKSLDFNNGVETKSIPYLLRTHRIAVYPDSL